MEVEEVGKEEQAGPSSPVVAFRSKPGPRCSKGWEEEWTGRGRNKKEKDWRKGRRIQSSSEDEEGKDGEGDEDYVPQSPKEILELSQAARESTGRTLRSAEEALAPTKPRIVAVTTLKGSDRVRIKSPGVKRGREEEEADTEIEEGSEEKEEEGNMSPSSRDSSTSRSTSDPKGPKSKRKKRGRPAINPDHEGLFTAGKIRQRAKEKELEIIEEKESDILDPLVKATSARAEEVDRQARKIMDDIRELPYPELTERALRAIEAIKKVASLSSNMKGSFVGLLWKSSEELTALNLAFSSRMRAKGGEERGDGEMEKLRSELSAFKTEQTLMLGENQRLRGQVEELRARVVLGETTAPPPPHPAPPPSPPAPSRRRKGRGDGKGKKEIVSDTTSLDEHMEVAMEQELSQEERREGIKARREVKRDLEKGTLPPAIRPSLLGKSKVLDGHHEEREFPHALTPTLSHPQRASIMEPSKGLTQEDIVRLVQATISQLLPQLGGGAVMQEGRERAQQHQPGPPNKDRTDPPAPTPAGKSAGEGKGGKKKRKRKKGKGESASQQGGVAPKGTGSPPNAAKGAPPTKGPTPLPRNDKSSAPPPWIGRTSPGGSKEATRSRGYLGPSGKEREDEKGGGDAGRGEEVRRPVS